MAKRVFSAQSSVHPRILPARAGFFTDSLSSINISHEWDTTHALISETARRGYETWIFGPDDIALHNSMVWIYGQKVRASREGPLKVRGSREWIRGDRWSLLWVRREPPMNMVYVTALHLLALLKEWVPVWNDPLAVLEMNEKLGIARFNRWMPETFVATDPSALWSHPEMKRSGEFVIKPLFYKGGQGIRRFNPERNRRRFVMEMNRTLRREKGAPVMLQEFVPHETFGDKRILLLEGKVLGVFARFPLKGEFRANISLGGTTAAAQLTQTEKRMVREVGPRLKKMGLHFVGLDVLDGKLSEINVTCPAGVPELKHYYGGNPITSLVDAIERATKGMRRRSKRIELPDGDENQREVRDGKF